VAVDVAALVDAVGRLGGTDPMTETDIQIFLSRPGELLPGWDDDWLLLERERLLQLRLHGLEAAARRLRTLRRFHLAVDAALLAVRIEPLRESAHRILAELHLDEGNARAARRCYEGFAALLHAEVGIAPSAAFRALVGLSAPDDEGIYPVSHRRARAAAATSASLGASPSSSRRTAQHCSNCRSASPRLPHRT
jgi:DNA-binding SARP family transcriptional activator